MTTTTRRSTVRGGDGGSPAIAASLMTHEEEEDFLMNRAEASAKRLSRELQWSRIHAVSFCSLRSGCRRPEMRRRRSEARLAKRRPQPNDARRAPDGSARCLPSFCDRPGRARAKCRASATARGRQGKPVGERPKRSARWSRLVDLTIDDRFEPVANSVAFHLDESTHWGC